MSSLKSSRSTRRINKQASDNEVNIASIDDTSRYAASVIDVIDVNAYQIDSNTSKKSSKVPPIDKIFT
jgi:hypothetical protein